MNSDKSAVPAKNLCLDLMGAMGSGITDLRSFVQRAIASLQTSANLLDRRLAQVGEDVLNDKIEAPDLMSTTGPHAIVVTALDQKEIEDSKPQSVRDYYLVQWAQNVRSLHDKLFDPDNDINEHDVQRNCNETAEWLYESIADRNNAALERYFVFPFLAAS